MKKLFSAILLLVAFPMFTGGIFQINGMMGPPKLAWAIALSLGAQVIVLAAGFIASPKRGKVGFFRGVAIVFYFLEASRTPMFLFALYKRFAHVVLLDSNELIWGLVGSFSGLALLLVSGKVWHLFVVRPQDGSMASGG